MAPKTEEILRLYQEGKKAGEIARELGLKYQQVYSVLRRAGLLKPKLKEPSPEEYAKFIAGLDIQSVRLTEAHAKLERNPSGSLRFAVDPKSVESFGPEREGEGFWAGLALKLVLEDEQGPFGYVQVRVAVYYASPVFPDEGTFQTFKERNLPVNVWPYLRLYVDFFTSQMGLPRLVLPALKV